MWGACVCGVLKLLMPGTLTHACVHGGVGASAAAQIGNPDGKDKPNKKTYDPRMWSRSGEKALVARMKACFEDLNCINVL